MTKEEAKNFGLQLLHGIMERNESYPVYANNVKQAIDALSESSSNSEIQSDLEEAASEYSTNEADRVWGKPDPHDYTDHSGCGAAHDNYEVGLHVGFKAGAEWQKEQMMKNALHGWLDEDNEPPYDLNVVCEDKIPFGEFKHGDKVRIIVVKEDCHE